MASSKSDSDIDLLSAMASSKSDSDIDLLSAMATSKSDSDKCGSSLSISVPPPITTSNDVYLSFRSTDISKTFVDHLCTAFKSAGIPTIYFDSELGEEKMFSLIPQAVQKSNSIIIVFSENYASSRWCLDELVEILRSKRTKERLQTVVPIFYHVDPADVIHQTGEFGTAFQRFKDMENKEVETWRAALIEVGNLSGFYLPLRQRRNGGRLEPIYISEIVKRVKTDKSICFSEIVKRIATGKSNLLHAGESHHPRRLTFRPKTVLYIAWETQNYDSRSPACDGDHYHWRKYGQKQVLNSQYPRSYYRCLQKYEKNCPAWKLQQSFDGQLNKVVHFRHHNHPPPQFQTGKVNDESLEIDFFPSSEDLFFEDPFLEDPFLEDPFFDSEEPNEVSNIKWNTRLVLKDQTGKVNDASLDRVSFSLSAKNQHRSLRTRKGFMLRLGNNDKLARSRVHEKDEDEPDAKRRKEVQLDFPGSEYTLFDIKEFLGLMENVLEYKLPKSKSMEVRNLKVMHIRNINLSDIPDNLSFPDLENLFLQSKIDSVSISSSIFERIPALRVLDMSNTSIKILPPSFSKLIKLEKLLLHGCQFLTELPHDIGAIVNLDFLDLSGCTKLAEIPESINLLKRLSIVVLKDCKSLTELPEGISKLRSLRYLSLSGCENLAEIPESIALLENLSSLNLTDCKSLTKLPESIRELRSLNFFYLSGCSSLIEFHAPEVSIHTFSASSQADEMEVLLDIHNYEATLLDITELLVLLEKVVQYEFLKSKIVAVRSLKVIHIKNSKLPEFPDNLIFPDLEKLFLQPSLHMSYIPSSFFMKMPALKVLDMSNTSIKTLPPTVSELFVLEQLILRGCELLMELPPEISALGNLRVLDLEGTGLVCLPDELKELTSLKCLKVSLYDAESYRESKKIVSVIPRATLSKLTQLEELSINADPQDVWCSAAMKAIMEDLPSLRMLKNLKLYLPTTELLKNLMELKWDNDDLPIYQNLSNFSFIIGPRAEHFISRLTCDLEEEFLKLKKCLKYINGENDTTHFAEALKHANALYLDRHWTIQKLSIFNLKELNELKFCLLVDCNEMQSIFDGGDFNCRVADIGENHLSLQYLAIHYLKNLEVIWNRPGVGCCLHSLKVLVLHMCPNLTTIFTPVLLGDLNNLKEITVEDCPKLTSLITEDSTQLTSKDTLPRLKRLSLFYLPELVSISSGISIGPELANIVIYDCPKLKRLPSLAVCNKEVIEIKGESEWWNALEWNEPEWNGGQPAYLHRAFSELDIEGDSMDELVPQYGNSLCLFAEECDAS